MRAVVRTSWTAQSAAARGPIFSQLYSAFDRLRRVPTRTPTSFPDPIRVNIQCRVTLREVRIFA